MGCTDRYLLIIMLTLQLYFPAGLTAADIVPKMAELDVTIAAGLHKDIKGLFAPTRMKLVLTRDSLLL